MTPEQAIKLLYDLSRRVNMAAEDHDKCRAARDVLAGVVAETTTGEPEQASGQAVAGN